MAQRLRYVLAIATVPIFAFLSSGIAQPSYLLESSTESPLLGAEKASPELAQFIVNDIVNDAADQELLTECSRTDGHDYRPEDFLIDIKLPSLSKEEALYFIRPSLDRWCRAFYGAHIFQFWLVAEDNRTHRRQIRYQSRADEANILRTSSRGNYDIDEVGCNLASGCFHSHLRFDGKQYRAINCWSVPEAASLNQKVKKEACG